MKIQLFKYSVLTVGIVAAMGITATANAASLTYDQANAFAVTNKATATYNVTGNGTQQTAESNEVTIDVTETGAFSLIATVADGTPNDDLNEDLAINPQLGSTVNFTHTLANDGNVTDTYEISLGNGAGDDFDYDIANSTITYQRVDANGNDVGAVVTIANGGTITLDAGESARVTVVAIADTQRTVEKNGVLTVSATSAYLDSKGQTATVKNTDNAITTTPIYAITKSAQSNLGTSNIDLNNANAYVDYTITITNEGNADGTAVTISDNLPNGLVAIQSGEANYVAPTTSGGTTNVTPVITNGGSTVTVTGQDIVQNAVITVTFRARAAAGATVGSDFVNFAVVEDDVDGDGSFDLVDSSNDGNSGTTENNYEDPNLPADRDGADDNSNATVTPRNQNRSLTITDSADKEVALQSEDNVYVYTITNEGTDVTEADAAGEVLFTVTPTTDITQITVEQVFVDANNNGVFDAGETVLTPNGSGQYDLNDAVPGGLASATGGTPAGSVNIGVVVDTNGSGSKLNGANDIGKFEEITITVLPQTVVDGTPAPVDVSQSSITIMQGIDLTKYQAIDACGTAPATITNWATTNLSAVAAGACVFYRLEATNTFTNTDVTNVALSDTLVGTTYQNDFDSNTSNNSAVATPNIAGNVVGGTFATLTGQETGNILFSAQISQTGNN